jgi:hypothetical protein
MTGLEQSPMPQFEQNTQASLYTGNLAVIARLLSRESSAGSFAGMRKRAARFGQWLGLVTFR